MSLSKFDAQAYSLEDLVIFFSFIEMKYMFEKDYRELAKCLDLNNYWQQVADKLGFKASEIFSIPQMYNDGICSCTITLMKLCVEKKITIGALLYCLDKTGNQYAVQSLIPLLGEIMKQYLIDNDILVPKLITNNRKRVLIHSTACVNLYKTLHKMTILLQINGFSSSIILNNLSENKINDWMQLVDIIIIIVTKNYKHDMENEGSCTECIDGYNKHKMSFYAHNLINNICSKLSPVHLNENMCFVKNNKNVMNTKIKFTFMNMFGGPKKLNNHNPFLLKKKELIPTIINILMDNCDYNDLPECFNNLQTFNWKTSYLDFFNFIKKISVSN